MEKKNVIQCPKCRAEIDVNEVLYGQIEGKIKQDYETKSREIQSERKKLEQEKGEVRERIEREVNDKLKEERLRIQKQAEEENTLKIREFEKSLRQQVQTETSEAIRKLTEDLKNKSDQVKELSETKTEMEKKLQDGLQEIQNEKENLKREKEGFKEIVDKEVNNKLASESIKLKKSLHDETSKQIEELQKELKGKSDQVKDLNTTKAEVERLKREKDELSSKIVLEKEKEFSEKLKEERLKIQKQAEEENSLKITELKKQLEDQKKLAEEMKRKAEQGSQQLQGEVFELKIEDILRKSFPHDKIDPVKTGQRGADILQTVVTPTGQCCGTIIWEAKRAENWSDKWVQKLKDDQLEAKAEIAVLVSQVLPKGVETFEMVDGIWMTHPRTVLPVTTILRQSLLEIAMARQASEGQQTKTEMIYRYLTGPRFRQRVEAIVEAFSNMQEDLDKEKKAITKQWAKREEQIDRVMQSTVGMYGDLQGIAGKSLQEIEGLEFRALNAPVSEQETTDSND